MFRHVRKIAKSDYLLRHVCLSVRMEKRGSYWTDFHEIGNGRSQETIWRMRIACWIPKATIHTQNM
jgi:hypothetical protein